MEIGGGGRAVGGCRSMQGLEEGAVEGGIDLEKPTNSETESKSKSTANFVCRICIFKDGF